MKDELICCYRCMCWHCAPKCGWNADAQCPRCAGRLGYPAAEQSREPVQCNRCCRQAEGLTIPDRAPETDPQDERFADLFRQPTA